MHPKNRSIFRLLPVAIMLIIPFTACRQTVKDPRSNVEIDISIRNASPHGLDWVGLEWDGPNVPGGILSPGISKTAVASTYPKATTATIDFVDRTTREKFLIDISLEEFQKLDPNTVESLEFVITSYTTAEVHVNGEKFSASE